MASTAKGTLNDFELQISPQVAVTTVVVSGGYPGDYEKGKVISGSDKVEDVYLYHAGTTFNGNTEVVTNGGRVMVLTGLAIHLKTRFINRNALPQVVQFEGKYFRHDIGVDLIRYND